MQYQENKFGLLGATDSYKISHWQQYPEGMERAEFYVESRGGKFDEVVTAGINYLCGLLMQGVTREQVRRANTLYRQHFGKNMLNFEGWMKIAEDWEIGKGLPLKLRAIPEGTPVPTKIATSVLMNTHPSGAWVVGHFETMALRAQWYPSTVATLSRECKKVLKKYLELTSDLTDEAFEFVLTTRLHDFGARGVSSAESAAIGGLAHLYNFIGTDTVEGMILAIELLGYECAAGISIAAREHSTVTCYGIEWEKMAYLNSVEKFGDGVYAIVYDSTDYKKAITEIESYKDEIIAKGGTLVCRPDSGDMIDNIMFTLNELGRIFGYEYNAKGYKVLSKHCRIIQGDEITGPDTIERVLNWMETKKWASENIAFGMGGGLLQQVNRDTQKYAMKMSYIKDANGERDVFKCPKGAEWKKSKAGRLMTIVKDGEYKTIRAEEFTQYVNAGWQDAMITYFDGETVHRDSLEDIRQRADV